MRYVPEMDRAMKATRIYRDRAEERRKKREEKEQHYTTCPECDREIPCNATGEFICLCGYIDVNMR